MSRKGGQPWKKHGGAHGFTHGSTVVVTNGAITNECSEKNSYFTVESTREGTDCIQDGGQDGSAPKDHHVLAELMASSSSSNPNGTDSIGIEALAAGGTTQVVSNAEWMTCKIGQFGGVFLPLVSAIQNGALPVTGQSRAPVSASSTAATSGGEAGGGDGVGDGRLDLREVKDISELFAPDCVRGGGGDSTTQHHVLKAGSSLLSQNVVKTNNCRKTEATQQAGMGRENRTHVSILSRGEHGESSVGSGSAEPDGNNCTEKGNLALQYRECLEELEKGSELSPEERELLENSRQEFQALEFQSILGDKSNMLMTPQELEQMPERGIEFEESVGPKSDLVSRSVSPSFTDLEAFVASTAEAHLSNTVSTVLSSSSQGIHGQSLPKQSQTERVMTSGMYIQTGTTAAGTPSFGTSNGTVASGSSQNEEVGTVSIATDDVSHSTQILVNTPQGQQIIHINTSDLNQATTTLHPLSFQGGVVGMDMNGKVIKSGTVDGITVEDGFLVIPVNAPEGPEDEHHIMVQESGQVPYVDGEIGDEDESATPSMPGRLWICQERNCGKLFTKMSKLKIHLMRHTGERPFKCSLQGCDWAFTTAYKLKRHEESHQKRKDYICDAAGCERRFTTIYNLNTHRKLHERPCTEECPECGTRFPTMRKLDLHMKNHRGAQKTYKCPMEGCDKMFFSPHCMGSHTRVHQQDRDLTCKFEGCGKVFDKLCRLKQHMRSHTGEKPYICNVESCGWAFSTASKLKRHQRKHTGERKWVCPEEGCNKAFMRAEHLKGHLVTHSGEKPFICQVEGCDARFTARSSMYVHIKKHNEADKKVIYFCPLDGCDKKYNSKTTLRSHIAKHYQNAIALATSNASDLGSLIPILDTGELQEGLDGLIAAQGENTADAANDAIVASVNSILAPDAAINHTDLIVSDNANMASAAQVNDLLAQPVSNSMVTQLIVASELGGTGPVSLVPVDRSAPVGIDTESKAKASDTSDPTVKFLASELTNSNSLAEDERGGSARTDYLSNHVLSDRARKRRKVNKESSDAGSTASSLDLGNVQELAERKDSFTRSTLVAASATEQFASSDLVTSAAITFRDPETGAIYVQTQLLQDDPPNPDLYSDDASLDTTDQASLSLPVGIFSVGEDSDSEDAAEFTGTTINLQDLA